MRPARAAPPRAPYPAAMLAAALVALLAAVLAADPARGRLVERVAAGADASQTYTLYLPTAACPPRGCPLLLVFDPRGRGTPAARLFQPAAEEFGWIVLSSNDTRSDGPWEPNARAVTALWAEVFDRYPADPERIYAAGFSGGAMVAWSLGTATGRLAGVIAAGGRISEGIDPDRFGFAAFGAVGDADFNHVEMRRVHDRLARRRHRERLEVFEGPHRWMGPDLARVGVRWMEVLAMKDGRRPRDEALLSAAWDDEMAPARALEATAPLAAMRRYQVLARTFAGLRPVEEAERRAAALDVSPAVARARKDEERLARQEERARGEADLRLARLRSSTDPILLGQLLGDLRIAALKRDAAHRSPEGLAARRVLESVFASTSFYLPRDLVASREHARAAVALGVAAAIHDDDPSVRYNLACALARSGDKRAALKELARAVDLGWRDLAHMDADPDLATLQGEPAYEALKQRLAGPQGGRR